MLMRDITSFKFNVGTCIFVTSPNFLVYTFCFLQNFSKKLKKNITYYFFKFHNRRLLLKSQDSKILAFISHLTQSDLTGNESILDFKMPLFPWMGQVGVLIKLPP